MKKNSSSFRSHWHCVYELNYHFYWKSVLWTQAYFIASTGGAPVEAIRRYIENQGN